MEEESAIAMGCLPHGVAYGSRVRLGTTSTMSALHKAKLSSHRIEAKNLTLGDLIASTYSACGGELAPNILQLAMNCHLVRLKRRPCPG